MGWNSQYNVIFFRLCRVKKPRVNRFDLAIHAHHMLDWSILQNRFVSVARPSPNQSKVKAEATFCMPEVGDRVSSSEDSHLFATFGAK